MAAMEITLQRDTALAMANRKRKQNAAVRQEVRAGTLPPVRAMTDPRLAANVRPGEVLGWQRRWCEQRGDNLVACVGIAPTRTCGELTARQLGAIEQVLGEW